MSQRGSQSALFIGSLHGRHLRHSNKKKQLFLLRKGIAESCDYKNRLLSKIEVTKKVISGQIYKEEKELAELELTELYKKLELVKINLGLLYNKLNRLDKKKSRK